MSLPSVSVDRKNLFSSAQLNMTDTTTDSDPSPSIYPQHQQKENCFDNLTPAVKRLTETMGEIEKQFQQLTKVNRHLHEFNKSFGAFLFGMGVNDSTMTWPRAPTTETIEEHKKHLKKAQEAETSKTTISVQPQAATPSTVSNAVNTHSSTAQTSPSKTNSIIPKKRKLIPSSSANANPAKRRPIKRINIKSIIGRLPLAYQEKTERRTNMENVLKVLELFPKGLTLEALAKESKLAQYKVTDCINALHRAKQVDKVPQQGARALFVLLPKLFNENM